MHEDGAQRNPHCMRRLVLGVMLKFELCSAYRRGVRQIQIPIKISRSSSNILAHFKHMNDQEHQASLPFDHKAICDSFGDRDSNGATVIADNFISFPENV